MLFEFTAEDVAGSVILPPTWYPLEVTRADEKVSQKGNPMVVVFFKCLGGNDENGNPFNETQLKSIRIKPVCLTNTPDAKRFVAPFVKAIGGNLTEKGGSADLSPGSLVGRKLQAMIHNTIWEGKIQNEPVDYRPLS